MQKSLVLKNIQSYKTFILEKKFIFNKFLKVKIIQSKKKNHNTFLK